MNRKVINRALVCIFIAALLFIPAGCANNNTAGQDNAEADISYVSEAFPLERNGIALHLDCTRTEGMQSDKSILLVHGVTYSSHEFDIDYQDYSLVRKLAREGYAVWKLDIAGYGMSEEVSDGFMPDSDYGAEDIKAAVDLSPSPTHSGRERRGPPPARWNRARR